eukprot:scaffold19263_cov131-Skeletonema_marinoi.AAC.2
MPSVHISREARLGYQDNRERYREYRAENRDRIQQRRESDKQKKARAEAELILVKVKVEVALTLTQYETQREWSVTACYNRCNESLLAYIVPLHPVDEHDRLSKYKNGTQMRKRLGLGLPQQGGLPCEKDCLSNYFSNGWKEKALRDSPIEALNCDNCGIETIEIDSEHIPKQLITLRLSGNRIDADGCRELSKLLQGGAALKRLYLCNNRIDDDGVAILVDFLQSNTSLQILGLMSNEGIFAEGRKLCLKLVNDQHINKAAHINAKNENDAEAAGKEKVIQTQLNSTQRAELAELQGVNRSFYSQINPLHLPEVPSA